MSPRVGKLLIALAGFGLGILASRILPVTFALGSPPPKGLPGLDWQAAGNNLVLKATSRGRALLAVGGRPVGAKEKGGVHLRSGSVTITPSEEGTGFVVLAVDFQAGSICRHLKCNDCVPPLFAAGGNCPPVPVPPWHFSEATLIEQCGGNVPCSFQNPLP